MLLTSNKFNFNIVADILSISKSTLKKWEKNNKLIPQVNTETQEKYYSLEQLRHFEQFNKMLNSTLEQELQEKPKHEYKSIELFAGAGGLGIGLEKSGFKHLLLNEIDKYACETLKVNRPNWEINEGDVTDVSFKKYKNSVDLISGGFPCQAFSYAGKKLGLNDTRGTLFHELARSIEEASPKVFLGENVRGLLNHDNGKTLEVIKSKLTDLGYHIIEPKVLKAVFYRVPQKRERLFIIGIRKDLFEPNIFKWPSVHNRVMTLRDALYAGELYDKNVPDSKGSDYPLRKRQILDHVPQGGYWKDLPIELQKEYMQKSFYLGGGKTGMARRLSLDEPSLTLTCAPAQKQTERCHPLKTRPLNIREYARIQTFPDSWKFEGSISSQYKQIGNAVPVNLAHAVGSAIVRYLNAVT